MKIDYFRSDIHVGKEVVASVQQWHVLVTSNSQKHMIRLPAFATG